MLALMKGLIRSMLYWVIFSEMTSFGTVIAFDVREIVLP